MVAPLCAPRPPAPPPPRPCSPRPSPTRLPPPALPCLTAPQFSRVGSPRPWPRAPRRQPPPTPPDPRPHAFQPPAGLHARAVWPASAKRPSLLHAELIRPLRYSPLPTPVPALPSLTSQPTLPG